MNKEHRRFIQKHSTCCIYSINVYSTFLRCFWGNNQDESQYDTSILKLILLNPGENHLQILTLCYTRSLYKSTENMIFRKVELCATGGRRIIVIWLAYKNNRDLNWIWWVCIPKYYLWKKQWLENKDELDWFISQYSKEWKPLKISLMIIILRYGICKNLGGEWIYHYLKRNIIERREDQWCVIYDMPPSPNYQHGLLGDGNVIPI